MRGRFRHLVFAAVVASSGLFAVPAPEVAAACWYGTWQTSELTSTAQSGRVKAVTAVRWRYGYTCASVISEFEIDWRRMYMIIDGTGDWIGPQRILKSFNVKDDGWTIETHAPNLTCTREYCRFPATGYVYDHANVRGGYTQTTWNEASSPHTRAYCASCTITGYGDVQVIYGFIHRRGSARLIDPMNP